MAGHNPKGHGVVALRTLTPNSLDFSQVQGDVLRDRVRGGTGRQQRLRDSW